MKKSKLILSIFMLLLALTAINDNVKAQTAYIYQYTDTKTHETRHMKIQYSGYQVAVWYKRTSAQRPNTQWGKRDVIYNDDSIIKYTIPGNPAGQNTIKIEYDPYNHEAIYVTSINGDRNKYFLVQ